MSTEEGVGPSGVISLTQDQLQGLVQAGVESALEKFSQQHESHPAAAEYPPSSSSG